MERACNQRIACPIEYSWVIWKWWKVYENRKFSWIKWNVIWLKKGLYKINQETSVKNRSEQRKLGEGYINKNSSTNSRKILN